MPDQKKIAKVEKKQIDYSKHAVEYDEQRFIGKHNEYLENLRFRTVLKGLGNSDLNRKILDIGCGTGRGLLYLLPEGFKCITGMDYTEAMLNRARQKLDEREDGTSVPLIQGDAFALPFASDSLDIVISLNFIHMFKFDRQKEIILQMHRVCRPGGLVVCEFDCIHKGLFFSRYLEQRRVAHRTKFNSILEIRKIFSDGFFANYRVLGTELPLIYRILYRTSELGYAIESITHFPPFNWLASRIVVFARCK